MKKNLSTLCFAGLVALTGLVATGCGTDDSVNIAPVNTASIHEYAIIANANGNSFTIKNVNIGNGTSSVLNNQFTTGVGTAPVMVKTHPNINVFYVLNFGSNTISQYTMDSNGGAAFLGTVTTPTNPSMICIHPSGGFVYVVGATAVNTAGTIRRFTVASNGTLSNPVDRATNNFYTRDLNLIKDGDFSFGGGTFHVGTVGAIESYPVNADGTLGAPVLINQANAQDTVHDIDVRPGQASLVASVRTFSGTDRLRSYTVTNGALSNVLETDTGETLLGQGDMASNGQYYVGSESNPRMFGFNVNNSTGALTALATNPMAVTTGIRSSFVNLDPSNNFMVSTGSLSGSNDNVLVARFRGQNGEFVGSTADSQSLNGAAGFDFFTLNF